MDLLGGLSREELRLIPWVVTAIVALAAGFLRPRRLHWTALGAVLLFAALNAGAGIYVLSRLGDPRWAPGGEPRLRAPSLSGTPVIGDYLGDLDSALDGVFDEVNQFVAFKQALPVALEFLEASGWALLVSIPLAVLAAVVGFAAARHRKKDFAKYRAAVDLLQAEVEQLKRQMASGYSADAALPAPGQAAGVRPGRMRGE